MKKAKTVISMREVRKGIRLPLPVQTGGVHKDTKRTSRQNGKISIRRGKWEKKRRTEMQAFNTLFFMALVIWVMGFGFSMIVRQHHAYMGWTGRVLRRTATSLWRQFVRFCRWAWRRYRREIIAYSAGVLSALYVTGYFR